MNKKIFGIIGIALIFILLIISASVKNDTKESLSNNPQEIIQNAQEESQNVKDSEKKDFISINIDDYLNKYISEEKSLVLIARPTCHYCQIAEPILHNIAYKYDLDINYLNTDEFENGDSQKLIESDSFFENGFGTPLLLVVGNNKINDKVDGLTDTKHYITFLKNNEFIK
ncbi:MAG: thioredoxin family protein [Bacilli bacterium]|nr:thioredoxin family protein [Bacilli bacterium]